MKTLAASPFCEQLTKSPLGQALAGSKEVKQLLDLEKQLKQLIGLSAEELADDIFGDAVVFAFRPAPADKPEQEQGLILVNVRDPKKLQALVDHLNAAQKKSGQLKSIDEREHNGVKYFRRAEQKETNYYHVRGSVFVFSGQEAMIAEALDHDRTTAAEPVLARRLREAALPKALFTAWINPRAFDDQLTAKAKESTVEADAAFLKTFAVYWKALDGVFLALSVEKEFSLSVALQARTAELPTAARKLFGEAMKPGELAAAFSENALLATALRLDVPALVEVLGDFMTKENRDAFQKQTNLGGVLGKNFLKEVGPDVGLALYAPSPRDKGYLPHAVLALKVGPGSDPARPVDQAILSAFNSFALLAVLGHNQQHPDEPIEFAKVQQGPRDVHTLVSDKALPPGVQPSMSLASGYLLLADAPETIRQTADALAAARKAPADEAVPLVWLSLKDWRAYLKDRREALAQSMVEREKITNKEASDRLDGLLSVLQFADRLEISRRSAPGRTTVTIAVRPAYSLRK